MKLAEKFQYSPNLAARNLKLNRRFTIGVFLPQQIASYYDLLRLGIRTGAMSDTSVHAAVEFFDYPRLGEGDVDAMRRSDWLRFDGVILAPGHPSQLQQIADEALEHEKPVVCVSTDAARLHRLASIAADSYVSGALAAELLAGWIREEGDVVVFTGDLQVEDHSDKLRGFAGTLAMLAPQLRLAPTVESHDSFDEGYAAAVQVLRAIPRLRGLYINTSNSLPVLRALSESGRLDQVRVITTDLFEELVPYLERGDINASLYQRPLTQGKMAIEAMIGFLARGRKPRLTTRLAPHIVLRSNLSLFTETMDSTGRE